MVGRFNVYLVVAIKVPSLIGNTIKLIRGYINKTFRNLTAIES